MLLMGMQDAIAILLTFFAAGYLVRVAWLRMVGSATGGCGSCGNCEEASQQDTLSLVQITKRNSHE